MSKGMLSEKIRKDDFSRILVTETLPFETPIVFSNDGLHKNLLTEEKNEIYVSIKNKLLEQGPYASTIPYKYKIKKNNTELRTLALMHPRTQLSFISFYKEHAKLICYYCSQSPFSIRAPYKLSSTVFFKNTWENLDKFKRTSVATSKTDTVSRHSSSYFTYRGHDRLYKFYNSKEFINIEKDYNIFLSLDVSKCFDSIYTHSISWATKNKENAKNNLAIRTTFGQEFDSLMQQANHNETNGIIIGPEISRVFSEIIFQRIDVETERRLNSLCPPLKNEKEYTIRRYVDDIFVFARNPDIAKRVSEVYTEELSKFNLHVNKGKVTTSTRPFFSKKSRVITEANTAINAFCEKFLDPKDGNEKLEPKKIYSEKKITKNFIDHIKTICSSNEVEYDAVAAYLISALTNRIKKLINTSTPPSPEDCANYQSAILTITEVMFFFYTAAPSVSSSYKLSTSIILIARFTKTHLDDYRKRIHQRIFELTLQLLTGDLISFRSSARNFVYLEALNIVLASTELGDDYMLPPQVLTELLESQNSYYDIISCLFYIKNDPRYTETRTLLQNRLDYNLRSLSDIQSNTEKACTFLDVITCPYLDDSRKTKYITRFFREMEITVPNDQQIKGFLKKSSSFYWFVNWKEIDLLNMLEKKELKEVY